MLVLHSYHYLYPAKSKKQEKYARYIGLELEKLELPKVIAKESPKKRDFNSLLKKYESKWVVDLHNPARLYDPSTDKNKVAFVFYAKKQSHSSYFDEFQKRHYSKKSLKLFEVSYKKFNQRYVGVELFPWVGEEMSLDFMKRLTHYLKSH